MIRMSLACLVVLSLGLHLRAADADESTTVKNLAQGIGDATLKGEYAKVIDATYDAVVKQMGGRDKAIKLIETAFTQIKAQGIELKSYQAETPSEFHNEGDNRFVVVPTTLVMTFKEGKVITRGYLLGISSDKGKTWKFVDSSGMKNRDAQTKLLPKLPEKLKLPEPTNPEIIKDKKD